MNSLVPKLAIISPCYNEEVIIQESAEKLLAVLDDLIQKSKIHPDSFIYFVDDGSTDKTWDLIEKSHARDGRVKGLKLSRNFGQEQAVIAGLLSARERADCFITIDSDLQDDLSVMEKFINGFGQGYDVIYGVKENPRKDSWYKRYGTALFNVVIGLLGVSNHAGFRLASKKAVDALSEFGETNIFLNGLFSLLGFKTTTIPYLIHERTAGQSKYSFKMLLELAWDGITSFSIVPLRIITFIGFVVILLAAAVAVLIAVGTLANGPGPWLLAAVLFVGSLQIISLGVVGEYIGKIYKETKARPRFIKDVELW